MARGMVDMYKLKQPPIQLGQKLNKKVNKLLVPVIFFECQFGIMYISNSFINSTVY